MDRVPALSGSCFCGGVRYRLEGGLASPRSCHCSRCRKAFSAQASAYALIRPGGLTWTHGEALLATYVGRHGAGKCFCSRCGSMLCGLLDGAVHGIALGCLDGDPEIGELVHIHVASRAAWERLPEGGRCYATVPEGWTG